MGAIVDVAVLVMGAIVDVAVFVAVEVMGAIVDVAVFVAVLVVGAIVDVAACCTVDWAACVELWVAPDTVWVVPETVWVTAPESPEDEGPDPPSNGCPHAAAGEMATASAVTTRRSVNLVLLTPLSVWRKRSWGHIGDGRHRGSPTRPLRPSKRVCSG